MKFEHHIVPGAIWVEIVNVSNKDMSPLADNNWRKELIGNISLCWLAGGLKEQAAYFRFAVRMMKNEVTDICLEHTNHTSRIMSQPTETETGDYEIVTQTSIYRLRPLSKQEELAVKNVLLKQASKMQQE